MLYKSTFYLLFLTYLVTYLLCYMVAVWLSGNVLGTSASSRVRTEMGDLGKPSSYLFNQVTQANWAWSSVNGYVKWVLAIVMATT